MSLPQMDLTFFKINTINSLIYFLCFFLIVKFYLNDIMSDVLSFEKKVNNDDSNIQGFIRDNHQLNFHLQELNQEYYDINKKIDFLKNEKVIEMFYDHQENAMKIINEELKNISLKKDDIFYIMDL